jgi:hypothetical protein
MEGIQHRLDCPARKHLNEQAAIKTVTKIREGEFVVLQRVCRYCHRAERIQYREPEGTSDEH